MSGPATIRVLDALVIDQMAAGEVVERPASVAKELVENAFDAGATQVDVTLAGGGLQSIRITDDGSGMLPEDADRCILRHATSKLRQVDDLCRITTLGFRGEALSSIAAVSRLTLTTRPRGQDLGYRLTVHGGAVQDAKPIGCPVGTQICVEELFYNVPARRKFMRAQATEQAHVQEALLKVVLARGQGGLVLASGSRRLLDVPAEGTLVGRAGLALGQKLGTTVVLEHEADGVAVSGLLAAQPLDRGESRRVWLFVNGRFVRDRSLQRAILGACGDSLGPLQPTALVYIELPAQDVDVNVHPQKLEVRFAHGAAVHKAVTEAVALAAAAWQRQEAAKVAARAPAEAPGQDGGQVVHAFAGQRAFRGASGSAWRMPAAPARRASALELGCGGPAGPLGLAGDFQVAMPRAQAAVPAAEALEAHDAQEGAPASVAHLPGLAPVAPSLDSVWRRLVPLGVAPEGYLCCRDGKALALVHLRAAQRAMLLEALQTSPGPLVPEALMMPPTWIPDAALAAAVDDYVIETAKDPSPWGLTLEAVGPGHYVVMAVPGPLAPWPAAWVAQSLVICLKRSGLGCHQAFDQSRPRTLAAWIDLVLEQSTGAQQGSAAVWGPSFLQRLHGAQVAARAPVLVHLSAAEVLTLT